MRYIDMSRLSPESTCARVKVCHLTIFAETRFPMPLQQTVDLSDDSGGEVQGSKVRSRKRKTGDDSQTKVKLQSEMWLRGLVGSKCKGCKKTCLVRFQRPALFEKLLEYRDGWSKTHKLDQDILAPGSGRMLSF